MLVLSQPIRVKNLSWRMAKNHGNFFLQLFFLVFIWYEVVWIIWNLTFWNAEQKESVLTHPSVSTSWSWGCAGRFTRQVLYFPMNLNVWGRPYCVFTVHRDPNSGNCTLYSCTLCPVLTVHFTMYTVHFTTYNVRFTLYIYTIRYIHYTMYTVQYRLSIHRDSSSRRLYLTQHFPP